MTDATRRSPIRGHPRGAESTGTGARRARPAPPQLDAIDRRILVALEHEPRASVVLIAQRAGLARGTVQNRLERMEHEGSLRSASVRVEPESLGFGITAHVSVEIDQRFIDRAVEALREIRELVEVQAPAGETDLLCRVVARSADDLYRVSEEIRLCPGVVRTRTSIYLRTLVPYRVGQLLDAPAPNTRGGDARRRADRSGTPRSAVAARRSDGAQPSTS